MSEIPRLLEMKGKDGSTAARPVGNHGPSETAGLALADQFIFGSDEKLRKRNSAHMSGALPAKKRRLPIAVLELQPRLADAPSFRQQMGHISRHSAVFFAGTIFTAAAGYLFKIYLARVLGAEALGIYALGMTIVGLLGIFNALGLPYSAVRFVAAYSATGKFDLLRGFLVRSIALLLFFNLLLGGAVLLVGPWVAVHIYHTPALSRYLGLFALIMIFGAMTGFLGQVLTGYKDVARRTVITNFIGNPLTMIFTLALVGAGSRSVGIHLCPGGERVGRDCPAGGSRSGSLRPGPARAFSGGLAPIEKDVISFSAVAFGVSFLEFLMSQADKILIGFYLDAREVGIYAVATALVTFRSHRSAVREPDFLADHRGPVCAWPDRTARPHLPDSYQMDPGAHAAAGGGNDHFCAGVDAHFRPGL